MSVALTFLLCHSIKLNLTDLVRAVLWFNSGQCFTGTSTMRTNYSGHYKEIKDIGCKQVTLGFLFPVIKSNYAVTWSCDCIHPLYFLHSKIVSHTVQTVWFLCGMLQTTTWDSAALNVSFIDYLGIYVYISSKFVHWPKVSFKIIMVPAFICIFLYVPVNLSLPVSRSDCFLILSCGLSWLYIKLRQGAANSHTLPGINGSEKRAVWITR